MKHTIGDDYEVSVMIKNGKSGHWKWHTNGKGVREQNILLTGQGKKEVESSNISQFARLLLLTSLIDFALSLIKAILWTFDLHCLLQILKQSFSYMYLTSYALLEQNNVKEEVSSFNQPIYSLMLQRASFRKTKKIQSVTEELVLRMHRPKQKRFVNK